MSEAPRRVIACLPIADPENPYQELLMRGLRADGRFEVRHGERGKHFAALRTWRRFRPAYIHYDWNTPYFLRRSAARTLLYGLLFLAEIRLVRLLGCRIVWTAHQLEAHDTPHPGIERMVQRAFARGCEWIRVMWPSTAERAHQLLRVDREKLRILPEGDYIGYYPDDVSRERARHELELGATDLVLLHFGSLKPYKGVEELLEAIRDVPAPNLRLVVAGGCRNRALRSRLVSLGDAASRVTLHLESVPVERVQLYFKASDAVVLPFRRIENSGSAILAMGFAKPVIAPALGALPERLAAQPELLYPPGGLRSAIERAVRLGADGLAAVGRRNREAVGQYRWEDVARLFR